MMLELPRGCKLTVLVCTRFHSSGCASNTVNIAVPLKVAFLRPDNAVMYEH